MKIPWHVFVFGTAKQNSPNNPVALPVFHQKIPNRVKWYLAFADDVGAAPVEQDEYSNTDWEEKVHLGFPI